MHVIIGASGQVGHSVVAHLREQQQPVKGIVRDEQKGASLQELGAAVAVADIHDRKALTKALSGAKTLFVITPEDPKAENVLEDTRQALQNYRKAAEDAGVEKIVGISSMGAQHAEGTGNLMMSHMLEHAFEGTKITTTFVRPAYYFSNWQGFLAGIRETGVLPSFYPVDMKISMIYPQDVAYFAADLLVSDADGRIYELEGPAAYCPQDVADAFALALGKEVVAEQIPRNEWKPTLEGMGFSKSGVENFMAMTDAVVDGRSRAERHGVTTVTTRTTLQDYIDELVVRDKAGVK